MTLRTRLAPLSLIAALALAACSAEAPPAPAQPDASTADSAPSPTRDDAGWAIDPADDPNAYLPTEVAADGVVIGTAAAASGLAMGSKAVYATGDAVYASAKAAGAGTKYDVYWTFQDGQTHKMESNTGASADYVSFSFSSTDGMVAGQYNVQIDANGIPLGITEFRVE